MKTIFLLAAMALGAALTARSAVGPVDETAVSMVPRGRLVEKSAREFTVKTKAGTKIKLEFERDGSFQEAQGLNLNLGDDFEPGQGMISLGSAARALVKQGLKVKGPWNLEKDRTLGWVYELTVEAEDGPVYHLVQAVNGKVISSSAGLQGKSFSVYAGPKKAGPSAGTP